MYSKKAAYLHRGRGEACLALTGGLYLALNISFRSNSGILTAGFLLEEVTMATKVTLYWWPK